MPKILNPLQFSFPEASAVFSEMYKSIGDISDVSLVGLDTSVLLAPYSLGAKGLAEIRRAYSRLAGAGRLFVPAQAAREFARLRSVKLAELTKALLDQSSAAHAPMKEITELLREVDGYERAIGISEDIAGLIKDFRDHLGRVVYTMRQWRGNDPVSAAYRDILSDCVVDIEVEDGAFQEEMNERFRHSIPPGFQDKNKPDGGAGDLIIWKTVLKIAADRKRHCIFVTGEEKNDWWTLGSGQPFHPRYELIDEYRRFSGGMTFHLMSFSEFLSKFGVVEEVVQEVQRQEESQQKSREVEVDGSTAAKRRQVIERIARLEREIVELQGFHNKTLDPLNSSPSLPWNRAAYNAMARASFKNDEKKQLEEELYLLGGSDETQ